MEARFDCLSTELLLKIFEYCSIAELNHLQNTCVKFHNIIECATSLGNVVPIIATNHVQQEMRNKCRKLLTLREKRYISYNWRNGMYKEKFFCEREKYIPWLVLTKDRLWISKGGDITTYKRDNDALSKCPKSKNSYVKSSTDVDICKFVHKQNCLVGGLQNGDIFMWRSRDDSVHLENSHESDVHSVDFDGDIIVSGSKDESVKLWSCRQKGHPLIHTFKINDRIWSVAFGYGGQYVAVGTASVKHVAPLHIIDTNRCITLRKLGENFRRGSGVLHIKWESPHILFTGGYDKNLRKWDIRTDDCVQSWQDPFYSTVYCFDTDNYCTVVTGTENFGRAVLWDTRSTKHVQLYYMSTCKRRSSPIYSLSFDACTLYTATDRSLNIMDFSSTNAVRRNYYF